jgi:flavin-dependent dehydrogenase
MDVAIVGGGITGLSLALNLFNRGIACRVYERAPVQTNRAHPPDFINIKVEELVGDRPFEDLDEYITQGELRALSENYKRVAGFSLADVPVR